MMAAQRLVLFDLDHTLLSGDSDVLWCDFLIGKGLLDRAVFSERNASMEARYQAGTVGVQEFADFYVGTLAGQSPLEWEDLRQEFLVSEVVPRIPHGAIELVRQHQAAGDLAVMTTATNRYITELTALHFGIAHLLATEPEVAQGRFTGRCQGPPNMRSGKVDRLHEWLAARGHRLGDFHSTAYSDSINDLPLLEVVNEPVVVDPDPRLALVARERRWRLLQIH